MNALLSFFCLNNDNKHAVNFLHHRTMYMNSHALHSAITTTTTTTTTTTNNNNNNNIIILIGINIIIIIIYIFIYKKNSIANLCRFLLDLYFGNFWKSLVDPSPPHHVLILEILQHPCLFLIPSLFLSPLF